MINLRMTLPPKAPVLIEPLIIWMVGEWEGWFDGPGGRTKELSSCKLILNNQFLLIKTTSEMNGRCHKGYAYLTVDHKSGNIVGHWIDEHRGISNGIGMSEPDKLIMKWDGPVCESERITTKLSENRFRVTVSMVDANGQPIEFMGELTRKI